MFPSFELQTSLTTRHWEVLRIILKKIYRKRGKSVFTGKGLVCVYMVLTEFGLSAVMTAKDLSVAFKHLSKTT